MLVESEEGGELGVLPHLTGCGEIWSVLEPWPKLFSSLKEVATL